MEAEGTFGILGLVLCEVLRLFNGCAEIVFRVQSVFYFFLAQLGAYKLVLQENLLKRPFKQVLLQAEFVSAKLSKKEIEYALDPKNYLGTAVKQAEYFAQD